MSRAFHELRHSGRTGRTFGFERLDGVGADVIGHTRVAVAHEPPDQVGAHAAQAHHAQLHWLICAHNSCSLFSAMPCAVALVADLTDYDRLPLKMRTLLLGQVVEVVPPTVVAVKWFSTHDVMAPAFEPEVAPAPPAMK